MENLFEVHRLRDDEQVEGPRAAEVGHDDGIDGHRSEELLPRCGVDVGDASLDVAQRVFDVETLARRDGRVQTRFLER